MLYVEYGPEEATNPECGVDSGVKQNFWTVRNFWHVIVCQLLCFSEQRN